MHFFYVCISLNHVSLFTGVSSPCYKSGMETKKLGYVLI